MSFSRFRRNILISLFFLFPAFTNAAGQICGSVGIHNSTMTSFYMSNFFSKAPDIWALCADFCRADSGKCKSFRYSYWNDGGDAQYCEFFNTPIGAAFIPSPDEQYYYYDIDCSGLPSWKVVNTVYAAMQVSLTTSTVTQFSTATKTAVSTVYSKTTTRTRTVRQVVTSTRFQVTSTKTMTLTSIKTTTMKG